MRIYLVQHGAAVSEDVDPQRPLSPEGSDDVRRLAERLRRAGARVERILHSGKLRARQTAEVLQVAVCPGGSVEQADHLNPKDPVEVMVGRIRTWSEDVMITGHLPFLSRLLSTLVLGGEQPPIAEFQPGSAVCLEKSGDSWQIAWMLRPDINP